MNAAALLLAEGQPQIVVDLLESRVTMACLDPDILVAFAMAIRARAPSSPKEASRAFDLFARAYDLRPDKGTAQHAYLAAKAGRRENAARRFFKAMISDAPVKAVRTRFDFYSALQAVADGHIVQIEGGFDYMAELVHAEQKRVKRLYWFFSAHALAYTDLFRLAGKPKKPRNNPARKFPQRKPQMSPRHRHHNLKRRSLPARRRP